MENLICAERLSKTYPDFELKDISFSVEPGMVVGLVGSNGAGTTTTLKLILGLIEADGGSVSVLGEPVDETVGRQLKDNIGVVFDSCPFPANVRVQDVATLGKVAYPTWDQAYFAQLCAQFSLADKKKVSELSRGMGMKLSLAFALAHHPQLLILDEPTAGLDPMAREDLLEMLRAYMQDQTRAILMSSHITTDLDKLADQVVCIDEGRIIFNVSQDEIGDMAGVAHLRASEVDDVVAWLEARPSASPVSVLKQGYETLVLVPDRFAFSEAFPQVAVERTTIEDYMTLVLKGGAR